jgi:outer membrane protein
MPVPPAIAAVGATNIAHSEIRSSTCLLSAPHSSVTLLQSIERALCFDPRSRDAWATIRDKTAQLAVSRASYLPSVDFSATNGEKDTLTTSPPAPLYDENARFRDPKEELTAAFTIFDFGLRHAADVSAKEALLSAYASRDATVRTIILDTAKAYYNLLRAKTTVASYQDTEAYMRELSNIADGRYRGGAALNTERLQAASVYEDAIFKRVGADGDVLIAKGSLATLMGFRPDMDFDVVDDATAETNANLSKSFDWLVNEALRHDPTVLARTADLQAAEADLRAEQVRYMPTLSIVGSIATSAQKFLGTPRLPLFQNINDSDSSDREIGLQITVPISASFTRADRLASARATVASRASALDSAIQESSLDVWNEYQKMHVAETSVELAQEMVDLGTDFLKSARGRYEAGAGSLEDALNAQNQLATSRLKHSGALLDLRIARLSLLSSIGPADLFREP